MPTRIHEVVLMSKGEFYDRDCLYFALEAQVLTSLDSISTSKDVVGGGGKSSFLTMIKVVMLPQTRSLNNF